MSGVTANPPVAEGKTSKRKKNKGSDSVANIVVPKTEASVNGADATVNGSDGDSPFVKELVKTVRNLRKKLGNTEKAQSILSENPGKSLEELLADRKLNVDQKKQLENKPLVESQLKQTEEQLEQYRKFEEECEKRMVKKFESDKEGIRKENDVALQAKEKEFVQIKEDLEKDFKARLLTLSRFLRTAAARRQVEEKLPENDAFEGVLLQLYGGDTSAVEAMDNLISGAEVGVTTVDGEASGFTFKNVHDIVKEQVAEMEAAETTTVESTTTDTAVESDPTVVHAGLTELAADAQPPTEATGVKVVPEAATVDTGAANAAATSLTSPQDLTASGTSDTWVEVRNPDETDTGLNATPAAITNQESWAEDVPVDVAVVQTPNDGFTDVKHNRGGRGRGRGGRGRGEGFRGRGRGGFRGDGEYRGRGRGRGGFRGGRGGGPGGDSAPAQS